MIIHLRKTASWLIACMTVVYAMAPCAGAQTFKVLYSFTGGTDGGGVWSSVVMDTKGNLYGTTSGGGAYGYGTVFELSPNSDGTWTETVLHSFMQNDPDGQEPTANLIFDASGNLYGTTPIGGKYHVGTAFQLSPGSGGWTLTLLHSMGAYKGDAQGPRGGLLMDTKGNLYGAASGGSPGAGAVYELSPGAQWTEKVIYNFGSNKALGYYPDGGLILDASGSLYGLTIEGGDLSCADGNGAGCGVVYKLVYSPSGWTESVLHSFAGTTKDGGIPSIEQLVFDSKGNLYGTTQDGGGAGCNAGTGCGSVFRIAHGSGTWRETVLHTFGNGTNGYSPSAGIAFDSSGNAYGATAYGGGGCGCGVVYELTPGTGNGKWTYSVLHAFQGSDGAQPTGALIVDGSGNKYGTAVLGGSGGSGVVYEITP